MAVVSPKRFAKLLRSLSAAERSAFLAAVWEARGWETRVEDGAVVASRGDRTGRVVYRRWPSRSTPEADVLVGGTDADHLRRAAERAGAEFVSPKALRDELLYGLDRRKAERLFEEFFGRGPSAEPTGDPEPPLSGRGLGAFGLALVVVVLLLAGATGALPNVFGDDASPSPSDGAGAITTDAPGTTPGATPSPPGPNADESRGDGRFPDGLSRDGVDGETLAQTHRDALANTTHPYALRVRIDNATGEIGRGLPTNLSMSTTVVNDTRYAYSERFDLGEDPTERAGYADGETEFRRNGAGEEATYDRRNVSDSGGPHDRADFTALLVERWLDGEEVRVSQDRSYVLPAYRVTVVGAPAEFEDQVEEYRAEATVYRNGLVADLSVSYVDRETGEPTTVFFAFSYERVDEIPEPSWVDEARNETAEDRTAEHETESGAPPEGN